MAERTKDILKTISMFDVDKDFDDREAREKLANLFRDLILNPEPDAKDFFAIFSEKISDILHDLDVTDEPSEEDPSGDDPVGVQDDEVEDIPEEDEETDEETEETEEDTEEETEEDTEEEIPDELTDSVNYKCPMIERANRFIYR